MFNQQTMLSHLKKIDFFFRMAFFRELQERSTTYLVVVRNNHNVDHSSHNVNPLASHRSLNPPRQVILYFGKLAKLWLMQSWATMCTSKKGSNQLIVTLYTSSTYPSVYRVDPDRPLYFGKLAKLWSMKSGSVTPISFIIPHQNPVQVYTRL